MTNWTQYIKDNESTMRRIIDERTREDGDCLLWTGARDTNGVPVIKIIGHNKLIAAKRVLAILSGQNIEGKFMVSTCGCDHCMKHITPLTRRMVQRRTVLMNPYPKSPVRNKKIAEKSRERISNITMEIVIEMRASGLSSRQAAKKYGICQSSASDILAYRSWKDYASPWAGLG